MLSDTSPEAEKVQIERLRKMSVSERVSLMESLTGTALQLSRRAVADLTAEHIDAFVDGLKDAYYISPQAMSEAIARRSCFNLIHHATSFKVDIFVQRDMIDRSYLAQWAGELNVADLLKRACVLVGVQALACVLVGVQALAQYR